MYQVHRVVVGGRKKTARVPLLPRHQKNKRDAFEVEKQRLKAKMQHDPLGNTLVYDEVEKKLRHHFKRMHGSRQKGKGFFTKAFAGIKNIMGSVADTTKNVVNQVKERVKTVFTGITKMNPICRKILEQYGNDPIKSITICREPIQSGVSKALNMISLGTFNKAKANLDYKDFFHLFLIVETANTKIRVQKNEVIDMTTNLGSHPKREMMPVDISGKALTLNEMMANTEKHMGATFLTYNAKTNNCQVFVRAMLMSNGIYSATINKFVMQDTETLFKSMPSFVEKLGKVATDLGAKVNVLRNGAGKKTKHVAHKIAKDLQKMING